MEGGQCLDSLIAGSYEDSSKAGSSGRARISPRKIRIPESDELVEDGRTLKEIGDVVGKTREWARIYINATGQYGLWTERKKSRIEAEKQDREFKKQEKSQQFEGLIYALGTRVDNLVRKESFAVRKTLQYKQSLRYIKMQSYSNELLVTLFGRYKEARNNGEKLSLEQLGEGLDLSLASVGKILYRVGLEPMYGVKERHTTPYEKKESIRRVHALAISVADTAYFLELKGYVVSQNFGRMGERHRVNNLFLDVVEQKVLSYRLASQIYEAHDLSFDKDEISQLFDADRGVVNHVIKNRHIGENYQNKIADVLRKMFDDNNIRKPYLEMSNG